MLKPGWLKRQFKKAEEDIKTWPKWMIRTSEKIDAENERCHRAMNGLLRSLSIDPDNPLSIHQ